MAFGIAFLGVNEATASGATHVAPHDVFLSTAAPRDSFTAHVFACLLAVGIAEAKGAGASVGETLGLGAEELFALATAWAPASRSAILYAPPPPSIDFDEEELQLLKLFQSHRGDDSRETKWIAAALARRSMSPNHLWQDLGLFNRDELGRLMRERFPELAAKNQQNMRWKKFFYRCLCELEGFTLCAAPCCAECSDQHVCFDNESGAVS